MGNWERQQEATKEVKEKDKVRRETMGKHFLDLSKLFLTAIAFSALSPWVSGSEVNVNWGVVAAGAIICSLCAALGFKILK